ncbi:MAG: serine hydrolase domain-containing protein, partial [Anaerolineae bacterium]
MRARLIVLVSIAVSLSCSCAPHAGALVAKRIEGIEHGLISDYSDPPWKRMDLAERMQRHHVPGVSITVINDFQVEWSKGYGVLEAGGSEPVTPDTLFQVASPGKVVVAVAALHYVDKGLLELDRDVNASLTSWQIPENAF